MKAVTAEEMKRIDRYAITQLGIPGLILMENAALAVISNIDLKIRHTFAVICGTGNNGGDGLAVARGLLARGKYVDVYIVGDQEKGTPEFKQNLKILHNMKASIYSVATEEDCSALEEGLKKVNMIIDALFGTGLARPVEGIAAQVIQIVNKSRIYTLSIDVPSGFQATTGEILGTAVDPSLIVVLQLMKSGLQNHRFLNAAVVVVPIGIPPMAIDFVLRRRR